MAEVARVDDRAIAPVALRNDAKTQGLDGAAPGGNAKATTADLDIRLKPGQSATIELDDGKGGPQQPPEVGANDLMGVLGQLVKIMTSLVGLIARLLPGGGQDGKGGPATTQPKAQEQPAKSAPKAGSKAEKLQALEQQFGKWHGKGKNSSAPAGPNASKILEQAYSKLAGGDISGAQQSYSKAQQTGSPVMLDLNGDGRIGTTGASTAKVRKDGQTGRMVDFDLDGDGTEDRIEWSDGAGDGFIVDDSDGGATRALGSDGRIDGRRLFGDEGGKYANGYEKLQKFDRNGDGVLEGDELAGLKMWVDNGDARVGGGELKTLAELGITRISVGMSTVRNARGEDLMRSTFTRNGAQQMSEDVWFAKG